METITRNDSSPKVSKTLFLIIPALSLVMIARGMMLSIASPVLIEISKSLSTTVSNMGLLFGIYNAGFVSGSITSTSRFLKKIDYMVLLIFALFSQAIFIFLFSTSKNFIFALIINFMAGIASGFISSLTSIILAEIGKGREAFFQNLGYMFVSLGAFFGPYLSSLIISKGLTWNLAYQILAIFIFFNFILTITATRIRSLKSIDHLTYASKPENKEKAEEKRSLKEFRGIFLTIMILLILATLAYVFAERGLTTWLPTFLRTQRKIDILYSGQIISFFWLAIAAGRFIASITSRKFDFVKITILQGFLGVAATTLAIFTINRTVILFLIITAGICYSSIWPNIIAFASRYFKAGRNSAISILIATTGVSAIFAPWLLGEIYTTSSLFISLLCVPLFLFIQTLMFIVIRVIINKNQSRLF